MSKDKRSKAAKRGGGHSSSVIATLQRMLDELPLYNHEEDAMRRAIALLRCAEAKGVLLADCA
jgi:hypothetical protein